jgi:transposase
LSRVHDELKAERVATGNRLREQLHRYFPQLLGLASVYEARWIWEMLEIAPVPQQAKKLALGKIRSLLKKYRVRSVTPEQVLQELRSEPLHVADGVAEACSRHVALLIPRIRLLYEQQAQVEREIENLLEHLSAPVEGKAEHRDTLLLQSLPGLGKLVCATMLAEASEPLADRDYLRLRSLCGVAPVTKRSGKQYAVRMRAACNQRLRTAVHHWTSNAIQRDAHWKARYAACRAAGHSHGRALRGIGDRLLATLVALLKSHTPYDPTRRVAASGLGTMPA